MKKSFLSIMLAVILIFTLAVPAFASSTAYSINLLWQSFYGDAWTSPTNSAVAGTTVRIYTEPISGYIVDEITVINARTKQPIAVEEHTTSHRFTMPSDNVEIDVTFKRDTTYYDVLPFYNESRGYVEVSADTAQYGTKVYIDAYPEDGYKVDEIEVHGERTDTLVPVNSSSGDYYFTMPNEDVTVSVTFVRGTSSSSATKYDVVLNYNESQGWVYSTHDTASRGTRVYITPDPDSGYVVDEVIAIPYNNESEWLTVTEIDGDYYFTMPASDVYVDVSFVAGEGDGTGSSTERYYVDLYYNSARGWAEVSRETATRGTRVYIDAEADDAYEIDDIIVTRDNGNNIIDIPIYQSANRWYFTMPADDVYVEVEFVRAGTGSGTSTGTKNAITLTYRTARGEATVSAKSAASGTIVFVEVDPYDGYELDGVFVTKDRNDAEVDVDGSDGLYYFTMPNEKVTVDVSFVVEGSGSGSSSGSSSSSNSKHYIDLEYDPGFGDVDVSLNTAAKGKRVYIYALPDYNCEIEDVIVIEESTGKEITVYTSSGDYYFTMPDDNVLVEVTFIDDDGNVSGGDRYDIEVDFDSKRGDVDTSRSTATRGTRVYIYPEADKGYEVDEVIVTRWRSDRTVTVNSNSSGDYYFTMPSDDVIIEVTFKSARGEYDVVLDSGIKNGKATVSVDNADSGDLIVVTPDPADGYEVEKVTVLRTQTNKSVTVSANTNGTYSFIMPAGDVSVTVSFKKTETPSTGTTKPGTEVIHICPAAPYTDVDATLWYHEAIDYVIANNLMTGYGNGLFGPNDTTSRAMITTIVWRLAGSPASTAAITYTDVPAGEWYTEAVRWAAANGILTDVASGTTFDPNAPITREQFATMIYRLEKSKGGGFQGIWSYQLTFTDLNDLSYWAVEAVSWCNMKGVLNGNGAGALNPKGEVTRAELAQIIMNYKNIK